MAITPGIDDEEIIGATGERQTRQYTGFNDFKLYKKGSAGWNDVTNNQNSLVIDPEYGRYPAVKSRSNGEYFLFLPLKFPLRYTNVHLYYGTEEANADNVKIGIYNLDFEPIVEQYDTYITFYDKNGNSCQHLYVEGIRDGSHCLRIQFDNIHNLLTIQNDTTYYNEISNTLTSFENFNTKQLGYIGIKVSGNSNYHTWIEKVYINYNKVVVNAEITFDNEISVDENNSFKRVDGGKVVGLFYYGETPTGKLKIRTECGVVDYNEFEWLCRSDDWLFYPTPTYRRHNENTHTFEFYPNYLTPQEGYGGYECYVTFNGNDTFEPFPTTDSFEPHTINKKFLYPHAITSVTIINPTETTYPTIPTITAQIVEVDDEDNFIGFLPNMPLRFYIDNEFITETNSDENGLVTFISPKDPQYDSERVENEPYGYLVEYVGNDGFYDSADAVSLKYHRNQPRIVEVSTTGGAFIGESNSVTVRLESNEGVALKNANLSYTLTIRRNPSATDSIYLDGEIIDTVTGIISTNNSGEATVQYTSNVGKTVGILEWGYLGLTQFYKPASLTSNYLVWDKKQLNLRVINNSGDTEVTMQGAVQVEAYIDGVVYGETTPISNLDIEKSITFKTLDGQNVSLESYTPRTTQTNANGRISTTYTPYYQGDIVGTFTFTFHGDDTYKSATVSSTITWSKISTELSTNDVMFYNGRYTNLLNDEPEWNVASPGTNNNYNNFSCRLEAVDTDSGFRWLNDKSILFYDTFVLGEGDWEYLRLRTTGVADNLLAIPVINSEGLLNCGRGYITFLPLIDINTEEDFSVKITFRSTSLNQHLGVHYVNYSNNSSGGIVPIQTYFSRRNYDTVHILEYRFHNRTATVYADDVLTDFVPNYEHSNLTMLYVVGYNSSPVTDNKGLFIEGVELTVNNQTILNLNRQVDSLFHAITGFDGIANGRWTHTVQNNDFVNGRNERLLTAVFAGDEKFKPCSKTLNLTVLKRIGTNLVLIDDTSEYGSPIRFSVPFNITGTLTDENGNPMRNQKFTIYINDSSWTPTTNSDGKGMLPTYRPTSMDTIQAHGVFDGQDLIDKYLPCDVLYTIEVGKDSPIIIFNNLPMVVTDACNSDTVDVNISLRNSIGQNYLMSNRTIQWYENIGDSTDGNNWETPELGTGSSITNTDGDASYSFTPRSGIRLIKAVFEPSNAYNGVEATSLVDYQLRNTYGDNVTLPVKNGEVSLVLDCQTPFGLYDLKIEYLGTTKNNCRKYADGVKYYGVYRKKGADILFDKTTDQYNSNAVLDLSENDSWTARLRDSALEDPSSSYNINKILPKYVYTSSYLQMGKYYFYYNPNHRFTSSSRNTKIIINFTVKLQSVYSMVGFLYERNGLEPSHYAGERFDTNQNTISSDGNILELDVDDNGLWTKTFNGEVLNTFTLNSTPRYIGFYTGTKDNLYIHSVVIKDTSGETGRFEQEAKKQFTINAQLIDEDNKTLPLNMITSSVDGTNTLKQLTNFQGKIIRHHVNDIVNDDDIYTFTSTQTRKHAPTTAYTMGHTLPIKPYISFVDEDGAEYRHEGNNYTKITKNENGNDVSTQLTEEEYNNQITTICYEDNMVTLRARAYYKKKKYDQFGEEIKRKANLGDVYHGYKNDGTEEYYIIDSEGNKTVTTKSVYDSASSITSFIAIARADMVWRDDDGNIVDSATTDTKGIGTVVVYGLNGIGIHPLSVGIENHDSYDKNSRLTIPYDVVPRLKAKLTANTVTNVHYNEPCKLNCKLTDLANNPIPNKIIHFNQGIYMLDEATTDENGYCELTYTHPNASNFTYECIFDIWTWNSIYNSIQIYDGVSKVFGVYNDKQIPQLSRPTFVKGFDEIHYGDTLTVKTYLRESTKSINKNKGILGKKIRFYFVKASDPADTDYTYKTTDKTLAGEAITNNDGLATLTFTVPVVGEYKLWTIFVGDERNDNGDIISKDSLFHWKYISGVNGSDNSFTVHPSNAHFINLEGYQSNAFSYGIMKAQLVNKDNVPFEESKKVRVKITRDGNTYINKDVTTNDLGQFEVRYSDTSDVATGNILYCPIGGNTISKTYKVEYIFNDSTIHSSTYDNTYDTPVQSINYSYLKGKTRFSTPYIDDDGNYITRLVCDDNGNSLGDKTVKFYEGTTLIKTVTTATSGDVGVAKLLLADVPQGTHNITIKYEGNDLYSSCSVTGTYSNVIIEDCNDIKFFDAITENWYASDGSSKWGLDIYGINRLDGKRTTENDNDIYKNQCKYLPGTNKRLRTICGDLKTVGSRGDDGIHTPTGVAMKSNRIRTNTNCNITFKLKIISNRNDGCFLGHFGLMDGSVSTAETAPARFEIYHWGTGSRQHNQYSMINNKEETVRNFNMTFKFGQVYNMCFEIRGTTVTCRNVDTGENQTITNENIPKGLYPYIFCATNNCEMVIRELKLENLL